MQRLATAISDDFRVVSPGTDFIWDAAAPVRVIDCVLSLNRKYDAFVLPRVTAFAARFPDVCSCADLRRLIDAYSSPEEFFEDALNCRFPARANTLSGVVTYTIEAQRGYPGESEIERLEAWARSVRPNDYKTVGVKGFGIAGFQYLRMLFGAETTKPDVHIKNYVGSVMGRSVSDTEALQLLEDAAAIAGTSLRWLDVAIWESRARRAVFPAGGA